MHSPRLALGILLAISIATVPESFRGFKTVFEHLVISQYVTMIGYQADVLR